MSKTRGKPVKRIEPVELSYFVPSSEGDCRGHVKLKPLLIDGTDHVTSVTVTEITSVTYSDPDLLIWKTCDAEAKTALRPYLQDLINNSRHMLDCIERQHRELLQQA